MIKAIVLTEQAAEQAVRAPLTDGERSLLWGLMLLSVLLMAMLVAYFAGRVLYRLYRLRFGEGNDPYAKRRGTSSGLGCPLVILLAVWLMRYAVGYYDMAESGLTPFEELANSLLHALQTFSLDEDYTAYAKTGKALVSELSGSKELWCDLYGAYAFALNVAAPIAGGALILELVTGLFPSAKLWFYSKLIWKERCYFSELNERSLALAKSIKRQKYSFFCKPVIIFTDAYTDKDNEKSAETLAEAKRIGALCIKDDLCHARKNRFLRRSFFLMDEAEAGNLQTLADLTDGDSYRLALGSKIFVFTENANLPLVEKQIRARLEEEHKVKADRLPVIFPIQSHKNLVADLLRELPLYEPIVHRHEEGKTTELNVTILGTGKVGTEMLLSSYWAGQMPDVKLNFTVISKEPEKEFYGRIDFVSPEILRSTREGDPVLHYNGAGDANPPYCSIRYMEGDVTAWDGDKRPELESVLAETDYCLVALGTDEVNMTVAQELRRRIGKAHLNAGTGRRTVIAYVVYNPYLCDLLNTKKHLSTCGGTPCVYSRAVGSLKDQYEIKTVYTSVYELYEREEKGRAKDGARRRDIVTEDTTKRGKNPQNYDHWASLSRAIHIKCKIFALGWIKDSVFEDEKAHENNVRAAYTVFKRLCIGCPPEGMESEKKTFEEKKHLLAWNERRRWCAFTRAQGYSSTDKYESYFEHCGDHKSLELKLHPCLLESDKASVRTAEQLAGTESSPAVKQDKLDALSERVIALCNDWDARLAEDKAKGKREDESFKRRKDFKEGDYPHRYFGSYLPIPSGGDVKGAAECLGLSPEKTERLCKKGKLVGAIKYDGSGWLVPKSSLPKNK